MAETTALPALLPCPFCGGPARLVESKAAPDGLERHSVECGPNSDNGSCPVEPSTEWRPTVEDAAVLWNTRATPASPAPAAHNCGNCRACLADVRDEGTGMPVASMRMIVCPDCGNKRCPRATDHRNACTGSNDAGQPGSVFGGTGFLSTPVAATQRVENGRARRWTCPEEAAIRQLVASALSLSVDDVTEDVSEMLHRLVYRRERPSRVLASMEGEVVRSAVGAAYIWAYSPLVVISAGDWVTAETARLVGAGALAEGSAVRVMIVADDPWTRESAASFAGVLDPESLDNTAPNTENDRDASNPYRTVEVELDESDPWGDAVEARSE